MHYTCYANKSWGGIQNKCHSGFSKQLKEAEIENIAGNLQPGQNFANDWLNMSHRCNGGREAGKEEGTTNFQFEAEGGKSLMTVQKYQHAQYLHSEHYQCYR